MCVSATSYPLEHSITRISKDLPYTLQKITADVAKKEK